MLENAVLDSHFSEDMWPVSWGLLLTAMTAAAAQRLLTVPVDTIMVHVIRVVSKVLLDIPRFDWCYLDLYQQTHNSLDAEALRWDARLLPAQPGPNAWLPAPLLWRLCAVVRFRVLRCRVPVVPKRCQEGGVWVRGWGTACGQWGHVGSIIVVPACAPQGSELWVGAGRWDTTVREWLGDKGFECVRVWFWAKDYVVAVRATGEGLQCIAP